MTRVSGPLQIFRRGNTPTTRTEPQRCATICRAQQYTPKRKLCWTYVLLPLLTEHTIGGLNLHSRLFSIEEHIRVPNVLAKNQVEMTSPSPTTP